MEAIFLAPNGLELLCFTSVCLENALKRLDILATSQDVGAETACDSRPGAVAPWRVGARGGRGGRCRPAPARIEPISLDFTRFLEVFGGFSWLFGAPKVPPGAGARARAARERAPPSRRRCRHHIMIRHVYTHGYKTIR